MFRIGGSEHVEGRAIFNLFREICRRSKAEDYSHSSLRGKSWANFRKRVGEVCRGSNNDLWRSGLRSPGPRAAPTAEKNRNEAESSPTGKLSSPLREPTGDRIITPSVFYIHIAELLH